MKVVFRPPADWPRQEGPPCLLLEARDEEYASSLGRAVAEQGRDGLVATGEGADLLYAPQVPVFDDLLALWLLGRAQPPATRVTEALCEYARLARLGHAPGAVPPDRSPDAILDEVRRRVPDLSDAAQAETFLKRSEALFEHLTKQLEAGLEMAGPELFVGATAWQEEVDLLVHDRDLYEEDRQRGASFRAVMAQGSVERKVDLLVLEEPASTRFRDWARRDPGSPSGTGYALLLARWEDGTWMLSADPAKKLRVGYLAAPLQEAEAKKRGQEPPVRWYDGARHGGTIAVSPRGGTELTKSDILGVLKREWKLQPVRGRRSPVPVLALVAAGLVALFGGWLLWGRDAGGGGDGKRTPSTSTSTGRIAQPETEHLTRGVMLSAEDEDEPVRVGLYDRMHALVIGVDEYEHESVRSLNKAVADAREVARVLGDDFGFDHVTTLFNEEATKESIVTHVIALKDLGEDDALFLFWAGHGVTIHLADGDEKGYLIPYDGAAAPEGAVATRNFSMDELKDLINRNVKAKHKFVCVDACFGGLFNVRSVVTERALDKDYLYAITQDPVFQVLTAGQADQEVLDSGPDGHSVFAGHLLRLLRRAGPYITASALALAVDQSVHRDARARGHDQRPGFGRLSGDGEFVFLRPDGGGD